MARHTNPTLSARECIPFQFIWSEVSALCKFALITLRFEARIGSSAFLKTFCRSRPATCYTHPRFPMTLPTVPVRTKLFDNPDGKFIHDAVLDSCRKHGDKIAIVDTSCTPHRRISFAEYADLVERTAHGLVATGIRPGDMIGIYLPNCWEFGVAFHAATMAGAIPTTMNPTYRDREVHYQMETSEAVALISDGPLLEGIDLSGLPALRNVYTIRASVSGGTEPLSKLFSSTASTGLPEPQHDSRLTIATLPFSSGTTGLPKGVMLSHHNIVANVYQTLTSGETGSIGENGVVLCFLADVPHLWTHRGAKPLPDARLHQSF